jgi:ribokinase
VTVATKDLLVIGGASLDVLHLPGGQTVAAAGGAALYSAAAAWRAGAAVTLLAPRPEPMPDFLQPAAARFHWIGPIIDPDQLPRLEIAHYGGGKAALLSAAWGAEALLTSADLPDDLPGYCFVHVAALRSAQRQLGFVRSCRQHGAMRISAGTYGHVVASETAIVRTLVEETDLFFLNENEANGLFGSVDQARTSPGKLLFVTLGERGALVIQGQTVTPIAGQAADEVDPTGAGDTFCGATLAGLACGLEPATAARHATALAARMIEQVGPAALWHNSPSD